MSTAIDNQSTQPAQGRRNVLQAMLGVPALALAATAIDDASPATAFATKMKNAALSGLTHRLAAIPRRRSFTSVPFMITTPDGWDGEAAAEILAYPMRRQMWEFSDIAGPVLGLMRESLNCQNFTLKHPDFLSVSATHGLAHLGLFSQSMWDKYGLAALTGGKFQSNTLVLEKSGVQPSDPLQDVQGFYGPNNNNITSLQKRGAVFIACHDSIHAIARAVAAKTPGAAPDLVAADLTNHLIPDVVLVTSVVGFMEELQLHGFTYAKG